MRTLLLILILLQCCNSKLIAQCFHGAEKQQLETYTSTGSSELDDYLNAEKSFLEKTFRIKVELKVLSDSKAPNAYADEKSSNPFFFDGTVYLGKYLLDKEIHKNEHGLDAVRGIMGHEFGHILQSKMDCKLEGSIRELHADFLAGYCMGKSGLYSEEGLKAFGESLYEKGDNLLWDEEHHGTPKQRYRAMMGGYLFSKEAKSPEAAYHFGIRLLTNENRNGNLEDVAIEEEEPAKSVSITYNKVKYDEAYTIKFVTNNVTYSGLLLLKNGKGVLRLRFLNKDKDKIIEETMETKAGKKNNYIAGSNPIDAMTRLSLTDYYPDSFYFYTDDYKKTTEMWAIDTKGNSGKVESSMLTDTQLADEWLDYLKWR